MNFKHRAKEMRNDFGFGYQITKDLVLVKKSKKHNF